MLCLVTQLFLTLCDPMECSLPGSSVHGYSAGKKTRVGCHALLQGIFQTQSSNPDLPYCTQIFYRLSHQGSSLEMNRTPTQTFLKRRQTDEKTHTHTHTHTQDAQHRSLLDKCKSKLQRSITNTGQTGHHQKVCRWQMLERIWKKGNPFALLVGM